MSEPLEDAPTNVKGEQCGLVSSGLGEHAVPDVNGASGHAGFVGGLKSSGFWCPVPLAWVGVLAGVFLYACFTRFYLVSLKPLHHDESLFAYYAYYLSRGLGYSYQPILHGPVLQFVNAFFFAVFGDNQFTMRLPAVLGGLALFPAIWCWRSEIGRTGVLASFVLLAVSPAITYYTRFLRNDVPYLTVTVWCALSLIRFFQTGEKRYAWSGIMAAVIMFSMMESSIFFFAACVGFLGMTVAADVLASWWGGHTERLEVTGAETAGRSANGRSDVADREICAPRSGVWVELGISAVMGTITLLGALWFYHRIFADSLHAGTLFAGRPNGELLHASVLLVGLVSFTGMFFWGRLELQRPAASGVLAQFLHRIRARKWTVLAAFAAAVALYTFLFTTAFTNLSAATFDHSPTVRDFRGPEAALTPVQIYKNTWDYWWDQHSLHRIKGPFHYYLPILFLYEMPVVILALWAWARVLWQKPGRWLNVGIFVGTQAAAAQIYGAAVALGLKLDWESIDHRFHLTSPVHFFLILFYLQILTHVSGLLFLRGRRVESFLTFWSVTSLFAYSYAGEKVPWLCVHVAGPLIILAGLTVSRLRLELNWTRGRRVMAGMVIALALLWQMRSQFYVAFITPASPAERIVYNHTSPDIDYAVDRIHEIAHHTNYGNLLPMFIQGEMAWPLYWYLRDMPNSFAPVAESTETTSRAVVLVDWSTAVQSENLKDNYWIERLKVREWWEPPMLKLGAMTDIWRVLTPLESRRGTLNEVRYQDSLTEWRKLWHYLVYREIWIDAESGDYSNGANEFAFCVRKDLDQEFLKPSVLNQMTKRPDVPHYP